MIDGTTGRQFSSAYQPPNRGRKRSALKKFLKDNGTSLQDIRLVFQNIMVKKLSELKTLKEEAEGLPAIVGFVSSALLRDYETGKLDTFNSMLDRIWGKPIQQVEMGAIRNDIPDNPEERRALVARIEKELGLIRPGPANESSPGNTGKWGQNGTYGGTGSGLPGFMQGD
jgi:hypothetical protein